MVVSLAIAWSSQQVAIHAVHFFGVELFVWGSWDDNRPTSACGRNDDDGEDHPVGDSSYDFRLLHCSSEVNLAMTMRSLIALSMPIVRTPRVC